MAFVASLTRRHKVKCRSCAQFGPAGSPAAGSPAAECIQAIAWPAAAAQNTILAVTEMRCRAMLAGATPGG